MGDIERNPESGGGRARCCWTFGPAVLDERAMELRVDGRPVDIERKSLEVLRHLLQHAGELVTKDQLLKAAWPGRVVTDSVLTKCIARLREALGGEGQTLIVTVHGYGYRLEGPVTSDAAGATTASAEVHGTGDARPPRWRRRAPVSAGIGVLAGLVLTAAWLGTRPSAPPETPSVAVLPFANLSPEEAGSYFADGVHEAVISNLARIRDLKTISRTSVLAFRDPRENLRAVAATLGVDHIVEGSVQLAGDRVRVTAQLLRADADEHLWAETYDRDLADVFEIQSELARQIARNVHATLTPEESAAISSGVTRNLEAYRLYLRGAGALRDFTGTARELHDAEALLSRAIELDPEFAQAHAALAGAHIWLYWFGHDPTDARKEAARRSAERAVALNPALPEANAALGAYHYYANRDYARAEARFRMALLAQPNLAEHHEFLGYVLRRQGRWEEALAVARAGYELDPRSLRTIDSLVNTLLFMQRYEEALRLVGRFIELYPEVGILRTIRVGILLRRGDRSGLDTMLDEMPADAAADWADDARFLHAFWTGDFATLERLLLAAPREWITLPGGTRRPTAIELGRLYRLHLDRPDRAAEYYRRARKMLERELETRPHDEQARMSLAECLAGLSERDAALELGQDALANLPVSRDAIVAPQLMEHFAIILLMLGEREAALDVLEALAPLNGIHSVAYWRINPDFRSIHDHPRFRALLARYPPRAA